MSRFLLTFFSLYALGHFYVYWRIARLPWVRDHRLGGWILLAFVILGAGYPLARSLRSFPEVSRWIEILGANWMGIFFFVLLAFLALDLLTLGGWLIKPWVVQARLGALAVGGTLALVALVQGHRAPVVTEYTLTLPGLPAERDGFRLAAMSDLHLGSQFRDRWLDEVVDQVMALKPDGIAVIGDLIDRDAKVVQPWTANLGRLRAPHGVFSVAGNHEYYADEALSMEIMEKAGYTVLRNRMVSVLPGLNMVGVDDLTVASRGGRPLEPFFDQAFASPLPGATVLLSHTPLAQSYAASKGAVLMISGHTHDGQIWPFRYLVKTRYPQTYGTQAYGAMIGLVTRGAGGWGPRMRLWSPGEIVLITLKAQK